MHKCLRDQLTKRIRRNPGTRHRLAASQTAHSKATRSLLALHHRSRVCRANPTFLLLSALRRRTRPSFPCPWLTSRPTWLSITAVSQSKRFSVELKSHHISMLQLEWLLAGDYNTPGNDPSFLRSISCRPASSSEPIWFAYSASAAWRSALVLSSVLCACK